MGMYDVMSCCQQLKVFSLALPQLMNLINLCHICTRYRGFMNNTPLCKMTAIRYVDIYYQIPYSNDSTLIW